MTPKQQYILGCWLWRQFKRDHTRSTLAAYRNWKIRNPKMAIQVELTYKESNHD